MKIATSMLFAALMVIIGAWLVGKLPTFTPSASDHHAYIYAAAFCPKARALCSEDDYQDVALPHRPERQYAPEGQAGTYRFSLPDDLFVGPVPAIAIPRFSDNIMIWVNGQAVSPDRRAGVPFHHHWNRPIYTSFSRALVQTPNSLVEIELYALPSGYVSLSEVLIGPSETVEFEAQKVHVRRLAQVRTFTAVAIFALVPIFAVWINRRKDHILGAIVVGMCTGVVVGLHLSFPNATLLFNHWPKIWNAALLLFVFAIYAYVRAHLTLPLSHLHRALQLIVLGALIVLALLPQAFYFETVRLTHLVTIGLGLISLALLITHFKTAPLSNAIHIALLGLVGAIGFNDYLYYFVPSAEIPQPRSGLALFLVILGTFSSLFNRLAVTLKGYEHLTDTMRSTIETRTKELEASQEKVVAFERQKAIEQERERIMFDLHDGVGGQISNLLAYIEQSPKPDTTIQYGLEGTIQDMSLIFDSLEGLEDLQSLLASLRDRIDGLARARGFDLRWSLDHTHFEEADNSANLHLVRLLQEAITNAIRHSGGSVIEVTSCVQDLRVRDNGTGQVGQAAKLRPSEAQGIGLQSMSNRARQIGAIFEINTTPKGTELRLYWPQSV